MAYPEELRKALSDLQDAIRTAADLKRKHEGLEEHEGPGLPIGFVVVACTTWPGVEDSDYYDLLTPEGTPMHHSLGLLRAGEILYVKSNSGDE